MSRLVTTAIVLSTLLLPSLSGARSWFVNAEGTGDAPTIQAAADSSSPGDTVLVGPGTYQEQVRFTSPATLRSTGGASSTTINADTGRPGYCVESLDGLIEGFHFEGAASSGYGYYGYAVHVAGTATIRDCVFENGQPSGGWASGAIEAHGDLTLQHSTLRQTGGVAFCGSSLVVEDCLFERIDQASLPAIVEIVMGCSGTLTVRVSGNVFRNNDPVGAAMIGYDIVDQAFDLEVSGNLFLGNAGPAVASAPIPPVVGRGGGGSATLDIRENTIARNTGYTIGWDSPPFGALGGMETIELRRNAITGNHYGPYFESPLPQLSTECNDVWANDVNWTGIPDPTGVDGNISLEPKYCDAANGNFTVATNSPLRDVNSSCHVQIGAFGVGCGPISVEPASWGKIKALYR